MGRPQPAQATPPGALPICEREHAGSLLHTDIHRTSVNHPHVIPSEDEASRMGQVEESFPGRAPSTRSRCWRGSSTWRRAGADDSGGEPPPGNGVLRLCDLRESGPFPGTVPGGSLLPGDSPCGRRVQDPQSDEEIVRPWCEYDVTGGGRHAVGVHRMVLTGDPRRVME